MSMICSTAIREKQKHKHLPSLSANVSGEDKAWQEFYRDEKLCGFAPMAMRISTASSGDSAGSFAAEQGGNYFVALLESLTAIKIRRAADAMAAVWVHDDTQIGRSRRA
jgi:hypothetical protein